MDTLPLRTLLFSLICSCGVLLAASMLSAWTGPTQSPPNGNVPAPVNVGSADQVKNGGLGLNKLIVFGNTLLGGSAGSNAYLNFGAAGGAEGYGFRDNNGVMEYKNKNGVWTPFGASASNPPPSGTRIFTYDRPGTYTWTKPSTGSVATIQCWGGGGGGQGGRYVTRYSRVLGGGGGGGGGYVSRTADLTSLPSTVTVTVGAGGTGGQGITTYDFNSNDSAGHVGATGGTSSFGSFAIAYGGRGGYWSGYDEDCGGNCGGLGGGGTGGTTESGGRGGSRPGTTTGGSPSCAGAGGGVGGVGGGTTYSPGAGGSSGCSGNGGRGGSNSDGLNGAAPGGGGGGGSGDHRGGNGAPGKCVIIVS